MIHSVVHFHGTFCVQIRIAVLPVQYLHHSQAKFYPLSSQLLLMRWPRRRTGIACRYTIASDPKAWQAFLHSEINFEDTLYHYSSWKATVWMR